MANLSEEEALALMTVRGHCDDLCNWKLERERSVTWEISSGVLDTIGIRKDQFIQLQVTQPAGQDRGPSFLFTLFLKTKIEQERIYQLELHLGCGDQTHLHKRSGKNSLDGKAGTLNWRLHTSAKGLTFT